MEGKIPSHADGETLCTAGEQLTIEILPKKLEVISPEIGFHV
jgi:diacylglycerol kinase family enzyme